MLQNKIYQNFIKEILKTFFVILFGLTVIAWTVRAVNFLDLIVENGYSITTYFQYSTLNLLGILTKFIPLSFLLSLVFLCFYCTYLKHTSTNFISMVVTRASSNSSKNNTFLMCRMHKWETIGHG